MTIKSDIDDTRTADTTVHLRKYQNPILVGIVLLFAGVAVTLIQYKTPTIMTSIMERFAMSASTASWLMSVFAIASIFLALPAGALAQRFGAKRMMIVGLCVAVLGSLIGLLANMSTVLIFSRAIEGVALTIVTTCGPIVVQKCVNPNRIGTSMGIWGIWGCLGSSIAGVLTPTVFGNMGFEGVWIAYAFISVIAAIIVLIAIRTPAEKNCEENLGTELMPQSSIDYRELLNKNILLFFTGFMIFNVPLIAIPTYVPTILQMQGFDPVLSGFISTAPTLLSFISSPLCGALSDRTGKIKPFLVAAALVMGPCTLAMFTTTGPLLYVAIVAMGLLSIGAIGPLLAGYTSIIPKPNLISVGMGILVTMQGVGQFIGTFITQALLGPNLDQWIFAGCAIMFLEFIGALAFFMCKMR